MQRIFLKHFHRWVKNFLVDKEGATAIEYGLLASLIGATVLSAQAALGSAVGNMYTVVMGVIAGALGS